MNPSEKHITIRRLTLDGSALEVEVQGKLDRSDYSEFAPQIDAAIKASGQLRILVKLDGFGGMTAGALAEDIRFDLSHYGDFEKIAVVGDRRWEEWLTAICKPFTVAELRYFDIGDIEQAEEWLLTGRALDPCPERAVLATPF